jgi:hypothetical protein
MVDYPLAVSQTRGCSLAAARQLIARTRAAGGHQYTYSAETRQHAGELMAAICDQWDEMLAVADQRTDKFLAAIVEPDGQGAARLIAIDGMT